VFNVAVTPRFVLVTVAAHAIFGIGLGLSIRWLARQFKFLNFKVAAGLCH
jgi:hypothetical protein